MTKLSPEMEAGIRARADTDEYVNVWHVHALLDALDAERRQSKRWEQAHEALRIALGEALNQRDAERLRVEKLEHLLKDCADDLEEEIQSRHPAHAEANYPDERRRYERDMAPVYRARVVLEERIRAEALESLADADAEGIVAIAAAQEEQQS